MTAPRTLLIARPRGEWSRRLSRQLGPTHGVTPHWTAPTISDALAQLDTQAPDLVVVLQETPDQFSSGGIQQLLAAWPLARLIVCHGPWCNGDGRNRDAWPLAARVPHTRVADRLACERRLLAGIGDGLAWTAGRDEIAAAEFAAAPAPPALPSLPAKGFAFEVVSPDPAWSRTIADQLVALGGSVSSGPDTDLLLIDADPWDRRRPRQLAELLRSTAPRAVLLLTNPPDAIPTADILSTLRAHPTPPRLEILDKLVAAARPATLAAALVATPARRSA